MLTLRKHSRPILLALALCVVLAVPALAGDPDQFIDAPSSVAGATEYGQHVGWQSYLPAILQWLLT